MLISKLMLRKSIILLIILLASHAIAKAQSDQRSFGQQILCDYGNYYSSKGLLERSIGLAGGGLIANSGIDRHFQASWQDHLRSHNTDNIATIVDDYSDATTYPYAIPFYLAMMLISSPSLQHPPADSWGLWANHSLRTLLVGAPEQAFLSHLLGAGRPQTGHPHWHLFKYHRAVSGHGFYGAIPLLNVAKQTSEPVTKYALYALSVLPALARINNDKHYLSQGFLGWWLAFCATNAVWNTDKVSRKPYQWSADFYPIKSGIYLGLITNL
jgi:hypothetical protein